MISIVIRDNRPARRRPARASLALVRRASYHFARCEQHTARHTLAHPGRVFASPSVRPRNLAGLRMPRPDSLATSYYVTLRASGSVRTILNSRDGGKQVREHPGERSSVDRMPRCRESCRVISPFSLFIPATLSLSPSRSSRSSRPKTNGNIRQLVTTGK